MPRDGACPDPASYKRLASGELFSPEKEAVLDHLEGCDACATVVEALAANSTLVELIRQANRLDRPAAAETIASLVARLRTLRPSDDSGRETVSASPEKSAPASENYDFLAPPQAPDEIGRLGPYRVLGVLGKGGMGIVFRADDPQLGRLVALKVMLPKTAAASGRERFLREARSMAAIKHEHIVSIYQVGEDRGVPFLAMEFLEGETLEDRLGRERKLPVSEVLRLGRQMASALAAAHERGLIHRDLKPANLLLEDRGEQGGSPVRGRFKMLDFGLARAVEEGAPLTQEGMIVGTPEYMSPEQVEAKPLDHRSDLFSLGCVLYRMLTGESPFRRANLRGTLLAVAGKDPTPPHKLEPAVPVTLSTLIMRLLAKEPGNRPESAQIVALALEQMAWRMPSPSGSDKTTRFATAGKKERARSPLARQRRWRIGTIVATGVLLAALACLWAAGVFRVKTPDGILIVSVNESNPEVYVDGEVVTVTWENGGKTAQISVKPGTHRVEVKKDGFKVEGEEITFTEGARERLKVKLEKLPATAHAQSLASPDGSARHVEGAAAPTEPRTSQKSLILDLGEGLQMKLARIPAGEFMMGQPDSEPQRIENGKPYHRVRLSKDFYIGVYLVTQEQYQKLMGTNPSYFSATGGGKSRVEGIDTRQFPVEGVSWEDAQEFCRKLSSLTGRRCTLPTDAQWEYACRAGTTTPYHFGRLLNGTQANCNGTMPYGTDQKGPFLGRTCAVGSYPPNAFGLYDMHGNVWEWCADYHGNGNYKYHDAVDPIGRKIVEGLHVVRGGSWECAAQNCRAAIRYGSGVARWHIDHIGFRVVCPVE